MIEERRKRYEKELHEKYLQLYYNEQCYEELICLANFSEYGQNAWLNCLEGEYEDLFTGEGALRVMPTRDEIENLLAIRLFPE